MIFLIYILGIIGLGLIFPKSKLLLGLGFYLLFIVSTHFQSGNDILNLENSFSQTSTNSESGERSFVFYTALAYLNSIGLTFYQIRCICFTIWGIAIYFFTVKFSRYPNFVISCSFLFPLLTFASQMRNGLTTGFLFFALTCLFCCKNRKLGVFLYTLLVCISGFFHYLGFLYMFGLIALMPISTVKLKKYALITCITIFVLYNSGILYNFVSRISSYYASQYFGGGYHREWFLFISLSIGLLINYVFTEYSCKIIKRNKTMFNSGLVRLSYFTNRFILISLIFLPVLLLNGSIYRVFQNIFPLSVIVVSNASTVYFTNGGPQGKLFRFVYFCFFMMLTFYYQHWQGEFWTFINSIRV